MGPCLGNNNVDQSNKIKNVKIEIGSRHLVVQEKIATGAYGDVWKCKDIKTGDLMAGKEIKLQTVGLSQMYQKEVKWLSKFSGSPGIVKYIGSKVMGRQKNNKSEGMESGIIVTEFYEISLFDLLKNNKFRVEQIHNFLTQILTALKFIHENGCIHLDLKMENILCRDGLSIKTSYFICDFGSSIEGQIKVERLDRKQKNKLKQFIESNSTLIYRAPELVELTKVPITGKTDIWMVGCVLYMLIFRKHPFEGQGQLSIVTGNVNYNSKIQVTGTQSDSGKKLLDKIMQALKGMLQVNIENRLSQDQLLKLLA